MTLTNSVSDKARGGYYTPVDVADALARWVAEVDPSRVLEPSAGDGVLVSAIAKVCPGASVEAYELVPEEAMKISVRALENTSVHVGDMLSTYHEGMDGAFDGVVGNPPFIRYQSFPVDHRDAGFRLMQAVGLRPSKLTNAWVPFVVAATRALRLGGRLAMVVPAEIMQVGYAAELREYLTRNFSELTVITFEELVFKDIQQETVLLLGVRGPGVSEARITWLELKNAKALDAETVSNAPHVRVPNDHAREKWLKYFLEPGDIAMLRNFEENPSFAPLSTYAHVDVGVVTGRNEFFVLRPSEAASWGVREYCRPLIGRSIQLPGVMLSGDEWRALEQHDEKCLLLDLGDAERDALSHPALQYVRHGESMEFNTGYKCRIRAPRWWRVPSSYASDAFLLRQINDAPRMILNGADATSTDTVHRVRVRDEIDARALTGSFFNSATLAFSEVRGRSYGGGVLELEPSEADGLPVPLPVEAFGEILTKVNSVMRQHGTHAALDLVDSVVSEQFGVAPADLAQMRRIWGQFSARRKGRKGQPALARLSVA